MHPKEDAQGNQSLCKYECVYKDGKAQMHPTAKPPQKKKNEEACKGKAWQKSNPK